MSKNNKYRVKLIGSDGLIYADIPTFAPSKFAASLKATNNIPRTINFAMKQNDGVSLVTSITKIENDKT